MELTESSNYLPSPTTRQLRLSEHFNEYLVEAGLRQVTYSRFHSKPATGLEENPSA